jgi:hypothetical protein
MGLLPEPSNSAQPSLTLLCRAALERLLGKPTSPPPGSPQDSQETPEGSHTGVSLTVAPVSRGARVMKSTDLHTAIKHDLVDKGLKMGKCLSNTVRQNLEQRKIQSWVCLE